MVLNANQPLENFRSRIEGTAIASAALAEGATNSEDINFGAAKGIILFIDITANTGTTPTLTVKLQVKDPASGKYVDLAGATTTAIDATSNGTTMLTVYPGIAETANVSVSDIISRIGRVVATVGGTSSPTVTASVGYCLLPAGAG